MPKQTLPSTQKYLDIAQIRDDAVIMRDGTLRQVLLVSAINFSLKGEEEQQAIIQGYVQFINTLSFPLQIIIQSRRLNINPYLAHLKELEVQQSNELLRTQTEEYRGYIGELVEMAEIMEKRFYVVVPYSPYSDKRKNFWTRMNEVIFPGAMVKLKEERFRKYKEELDRRTGNVIDGLMSIGLHVSVLDTQALIELFWQSYNPPKGVQQPNVDLTKIQTE